MTPERIGQILLALHLAGWRVEIGRARDLSRVVLRAPVTWDGEAVTVGGSDLGSALASAWTLACELDPGPARRMAEIGGAS